MLRLLMSLMAASLLGGCASDNLKISPVNPDAFVKDLAAYDIVDLAAREQTLEELFMHLYGTTNQVEKGGSHE